MSYSGQPLKRVEDPRLVTGKGSYVADINLPGMLFAAVLRSPHAHASIRSIDASPARDLPGVVAVLAGKDIVGAVKDIPARRVEELGDVRVPQHPILPTDKVCYVGQAVAVLVAQDPRIAKDALELIRVEYELLPPIVDPLEAAKPESKPIHDWLGSNVVSRYRVGRGDLDSSFAQADCIVRGTYHVPRLSPAPMEGRGLVARYEAETQLLTLWASTQTPYKLKDHLGSLLSRPPRDIRVLAPDVGGGFGQKVEIWPEDVVLSYLAILLERPVKWIEERWENLLAYHGRGYHADVEAAARKDGSVLGMRLRMVADLGAYCLTSTLAVPVNASHRAAGPYAIPDMDVECLSVTTNKPPTGPYRGAGAPETAFFLERTMDLIARELKLDPAEVRRRNFVPPDAFPYTAATGLTYDSGNYAPLLDRALELADYSGYRRAQAQRGSEDPLIGVGVAAALKAAGGPGGPGRKSVARIIVEPTGEVKVYTEVSPHGQGTETTFAQIVADVLGVDLDDIQVLHGDTEMLESGQGTFASRGLTVGGSAVYLSAQDARRKMALIASHTLECPPEAITFQEGKVFDSRDPEKAMAFSDVASAGHRPDQLPVGVEAGLEFPAAFNLVDAAFGFGAHVAVVEVDRDTGAIKFLRYAAVHDCGRAINPKLLEGQVDGALVQGLGPALAEAMVYSPEGQPVTGSFMDYAMPIAEEMPATIMDIVETPSPTNPLGVRGIGELPTVAAPVAVTNAVVDALSQMGVDHLDAPLTLEKIWRAIQGREARLKREL